jgi:hypothetical protein
MMYYWQMNTMEFSKINRQSRDTTVQRSGRATYNDACTGDRYAAAAMMKNALTKSTMTTTMVQWYV